MNPVRLWSVFDLSGNSPWWVILSLAVALAAASFLLQGSSGINLADEGFLWYGVEQTVHGAVPMRDFQSYDPGRYYWSAGWAFLFGKGLVALRLSEAAFQVIGLFFGLLLANRIAHGWGFLAAVGFMLLVWMFPTHKVFDHTLLLGGTWIAVRLIEEASPGRIFAAGVFVGLSAFFGRNHALYNFLAQAALFFYLACKSHLSFSGLGLWAAGIGVGLLPLIGLSIFAAGFAPSYFESVRSILRSGTNLALPIPWPWRTSALSAHLAAPQFLLGLFLVLLPLSYLAALFVSFLMRAEVIHDRALFIACAFIGPFYLHHAFSRADFSHLAQAIHPLLLGTLALSCALAGCRYYRWAVIVTLIAMALVTLVPLTAVFQRFTSRTPWQAVEVGGKVFLPPGLAKPILCLQKFAAENIPPQDGLLVAPYSPGLYPILRRKSPLWDLAFLFSSTGEREKEMIHRLAEQNVRWAIIWDTSPEFRLSITHRLVWQYLTTNFDPVAISCLPPSVKVLRRKF